MQICITSTYRRWGIIAFPLGLISTPLQWLHLHSYANHPLHVTLPAALSSNLAAGCLNTLIVLCHTTSVRLGRKLWNFDHFRHQHLWELHGLVMMFGVISIVALWWYLPFISSELVDWLSNEKRFHSKCIDNLYYVSKYARFGLEPVSGTSTNRSRRERYSLY